MSLFFTILTSEEKEGEHTRAELSPRYNLPTWNL